MGTPNDHELVKKTGVNRDVNRGVIDAKTLEERFKYPDSKNSLMRGWSNRTAVRRVRERAFHPHGPQQVITISPDMFAVFRTSPQGDQHILSLINVTRSETSFEIDLSEIDMAEAEWYGRLWKRTWSVVPWPETRET